MSAKLRPDDCRAVDLLFDRIWTTARKGDGQVVYAAANPALRQRVDRLQRLLLLLDLHEEIEPPHNLAARTLKRIESATHPHTSRTPINHHDTTSPSA